ncbi:uncharacterized protein LOC132296293 [Cornus florida]|uniref:uncharacterized protein LOC132296293 n=1 Tax=Cornus florida TaxID=4283 RepID=UPI00289E5A08|nr:uncharacterized protein LOC132296293 [Cornus florida]
MDMNYDNVDQCPSKDIHFLDGENGEDVVVIEQADAATWCDAYQEKFMLLMEEEVRKGNRTSTTFNPIGWTHIVDAMLVEIGKKYTKDQCKQKFNTIRALYKDCKQILSETSVGYNSETGMIELEAERWGRLCKHVHPSTKSPKPHQVQIMSQVATHEAAIQGMTDVERPTVEGPIDLSPTPIPVAKKPRKESFASTMSQVMAYLTNIGNAKADKIAKTIAESSSSCQPSCVNEMPEVTSPSKKEKEKEMDPQLEECLGIVNTLVGIDDTHYAKIIRMFGENKVWRDIFFRIPGERKVGIVDMDIRTILTMYDDDDEEEILVLIAAIKNNPKFYLYFKNCVGAIDGTHIHAVVPVGQQIPFRGRKGDTAQNVMAVCSFDMKFTYILAGWEGSANDSKILNECIQNEDFNFPSLPEAKKITFPYLCI